MLACTLLCENFSGTHGSVVDRVNRLEMSEKWLVFCAHYF